MFEIREVAVGHELGEVTWILLDDPDASEWPSLDGRHDGSALTEQLGIAITV